MHNFKAIKISENTYWVGAIDWGLRDFHGYATNRGTTYNAYLILDNDGAILIDTVKAPFYAEMMARISSIIDPKSIKYIISNHAEMDHSGSLPQAIQDIKPAKVYASKMGVTALKDHFNMDLGIEVAPTELTLGHAKLKFIETRMLHWPDSMFTFFENDGILFSQDGFGMHLASSKIFADENNREIVYYESAKYFANILLPYTPFIKKLFTALPSLNLNIKMIAPDHGPIWRTKEDIDFILSNWQKWSEQKYYNKAVILYDTMWQSTAKLARSIADGLMDNGVEVVVMPISVVHRSDISTELLEAGALLIGSPTINQQIFPSIADSICYLKGLKPQNLIGQVFGSHGWAGEALKILTKDLTEMGVELAAEPLGVKYVPNENDLIQAHELGAKIAKTLQQKLAEQNS
ncbi:MAG: FprA family A-type flavoprotein [Gammaproteobacteria bacterium]|nr:FprA family A-type flavoprotein [Gammaproteobacteria bacterium]